MPPPFHKYNLVFYSVSIISNVSPVFFAITSIDAGVLKILCNLTLLIGTADFLALLKSDFPRLA